ncbi:cyclin-O [Colossoma macropomum]|uniref:cyclin-O n=1 Tax=Colossoma macropomum TaxID=42526 RepID=UPI00186422D2|nr:cyclin-O [Colossoma macropomum]
MSTFSDSGFEEDLQSPSPSKLFKAPQTRELNERLTADCQEMNYDESCFIIQKNNEKKFLAVNCLACQPQITAEARCKLVSWLIAVYKHFSLSFESCCLAVNIMDRFLVTTSVAADCFQLLGVTSLLIATKHVEVYSPRIKQLLSLCCNSFSREQLCNLECLILVRLNFRLAAPTLAFFLDYFINWELSWHRVSEEDAKIIRVHEGKKCKGWKPTEDQLSTVKKYKSFARKVCELSLADYAFNKYQPSVIVQSAINLTKDLFRRQLKQSSLEHSGSSEILDLLSIGDHRSSGSDTHTLIQQCTEELKLLVSLNQESIQDLIALV